MKKLKKCNPSSAALGILLALTVAPVTAATSPANLVVAQAASVFPLPASVPEGTTVKIDGSSSMAAINQALGDRFKAQFPAAQVSLGNSDSESALKAVADGTLDLAAVGRPLTAAEQAQGLVSVAVARHKIAVFVGAENPFQDGLTGEQFASIFRGETTDWSQVGGAEAPIRFIDRPEISDTRLALPNYPVFKTGEFQSGVNTIRAATDSTDALIRQLGRDGMSYAIVDQVITNPAVRMLPLYGTLPTDSRYPFSQALTYVYKGANPSPAVQAFLAVATAPEAQQAIESARVAGAIAPVASAAPVPSAVPPAVASPTPSPQLNAVASPSVTPAPGTAAAPPEVSPDGLIGTITQNPLWLRWWWLLPVVVGLALLAWLLRGRSQPEAVLESDASPPATVVPPPPSEDSRIILTARNCQQAYAYWEVADADKARLQQQGGEHLTLRLYDVTDIDAHYEPPHSIHEFGCPENVQDLHLPVPLDNRDYVTELGYVTAEADWLPLARSQSIRIPACVPSVPEAVPVTALGESGAALAAGLPASVPAPAQTVAQATGSRIVLVPRDAQQVYAYWELQESDQAVLRQQGGAKLALRVYEASQPEPDSADQLATFNFRQYDCDEETQELQVPVPLGDRDYMAEIGYVSSEGRWLSVAKSDPVRVAAGNTSTWLGTAAKPLAVVGQTHPPTLPNGNRESSARAGTRSTPENRLILVPRSAEEVYAYWEVSESQKESLRQRGGQRLVLRVYDITGMNAKNNQPPRGVQQFECDETANDRLVSVPAYGDYIATLGYVASEGQWLLAARSAPVRIRSANPSTPGSFS
jgi:phosphate transport system substrate-binding protein